MLSLSQSVKQSENASDVASPDTETQNHKSAEFEATNSEGTKDTKHTQTMALDEKTKELINKSTLGEEIMQHMTREDQTLTEMAKELNSIEKEVDQSKTLLEQKYIEVDDLTLEAMENIKIIQDTAIFEQECVEVMTLEQMALLTLESSGQIERMRRIAYEDLLSRRKRQSKINEEYGDLLKEQQELMEKQLNHLGNVREEVIEVIRNACSNDVRAVIEQGRVSPKTEGATVSDSTGIKDIIYHAVIASAAYFFIVCGSRLVASLLF